MRKFNTPREDRIARVVLADENHRINRRAMLMNMIDERLELRREEDNWIIRDRYTDELCKIEEALDELMRAKVGDELTYCVIYQYSELKIKF